MMQSLLIKLGMLAMTMGVVFWIGWQAPQASVKKHAPMVSTDAASLPAVAPSEAEQKTVDQSVDKARVTKMPVAAKVMRAQALHRGLVDLNRASMEDLESLPGIGPVLAQRVIAYRKSVGRFQAVEELREVKGIGVKKFARVKPLVTVAASGPKEKTEKHPL
jgi:competence protein ComEA